MLILTLSILSTRLNIMKMILRNVDKITEFDEGIGRSPASYTSHSGEWHEKSQFNEMMQYTGK